MHLSINKKWGNKKVKISLGGAEQEKISNQETEKEKRKKFETNYGNS